jgi:nicotinamidase-related amidase
MFGIATSGVVLSTLLEASDADYDLVVIADCCADMNADLHSALFAHLFPRRAAIITSDEFVATLATGD